MQDNFSQMLSFLDSEVSKNSTEMFYNVAVILRHKDGHKSGNSKNRTIKQYFVSNSEELEKFKDEIVLICEMFGARAYIDVQKRSYHDYMMQLNKDLAERMFNGNVNKLYRVAYSSAAQCKRDRKWILDIDDYSELIPIKEYLSSIGVIILMEVKTHTGYHYIVKPFDLREFEKKFIDIEVKKNNMTLLYYPKSLDL